MRHLPATLAAAALLAIACGDPVTPTKPREEVRDIRHKVPALFEGKDLPWYGGQIERSSETGMTVSYARELTPEQIKEFWPAALEAEGWTETSRTEAGNGTLIVNYSLSDSRTALVTIRPEGATVWWVIISINA